jgi:CDGSH-type Zn-finger protein
MPSSTAPPPKIPSFFQALRCQCGQAKGDYCDGTHLGFQARDRRVDDPAHSVEAGEKAPPRETNEPS